MDVFSAIILGLIQGLTEFLPVSSSGHLVIVQSLLGFKEPPILFDVMLHVGTLCAVLTFFRRDILMIIQGIFKPSSISKVEAKSEVDQSKWERTPASVVDEHPVQKNEGRWFAILIIIGTIPAAVVGAVFKNFLEGLFASAITVGFTMWITAFVLFMADRVRRREKEVTDMTIFDSVVIGIMQAIAITPGISRSGFTISSGIFRKLTAETAARFSFLLSVPAILGALILEVRKIENLSQEAIGAYLVGTIVAAVVGYLSITLLIRMIRVHQLKIFSIYLWVVGLVVIWWHILLKPAAL
jgi:undecaprenyl-diphosphatase